MIEKETNNTNTSYNFDDIRPYQDAEVPLRLRQLVQDPLCMQLINYLWPDMKLSQVEEKVARVHTSLDFQLEFMNDAIHKILELSANGYSSSGFDQLEPGSRHLFVANHRDIFLDAAILQIVLVKHGFPTTEISFGSNLSEEGFITTFAKLNRMFPIARQGSSKELYEFSRKLSAYIRHTVTQRDTSVWIAQRNGRTKDGNDLTQTGLLKMLNMSGTGNFVEDFANLSIVPVSISYEFEPCDFLKTRETFMASQQAGYVKEEGEDLKSIVTGLKQFKGHIHLAAGKPINADVLATLSPEGNVNEKYKALASLIDQEITKGFHLYPNNYIAADLLHEKKHFESHYTNQDKETFLKYMTKGIQTIEGDKTELNRILLNIYASPVH